MSGPLVPGSSSGASAFAQQGQVDWVALGKLPVSFTIDVLSRLSKSGVDPITFEIGRVVCRDLTLGPLAQKRVYESLTNLKSFSSYGRVIWFGFGVRHIMHDLASTEQGMTCVAICAALKVSYQSFFGATFLRELSRRLGAPDGLLPALHQWQALLDVCTGALSASKFPRLVDGFARIVAPTTAGEPMPHFEPTTPIDLAQALCLISDVARGCITSCTFVGGIDCAWLAAVAEWLYCIAPSANVPRVVILKSEDSSQPALALSKAFILPRGKKLIVRNEHSPLWFERRSDWSHILRDAFGDAIGDLLEGSVGESFAYLLGYAAELGKQYHDKRLRKGDAYYERWPVIDFNPDAASQTIFPFAGKCLPELNDCLNRSGVRHGERTYSEPDAFDSVSTIMSLLYRVMIHQDVLPSALGFCEIYWRAHREHASRIDPVEFHGQRVRYGAGEDKHLQNVLLLFGSARKYTFEPGMETSNAFAAVSAHTLCAYYQLLQDPWLSPIDASKIILIPGHIEHQSARFLAVADMQVNMNFNEDISSMSDFMNGRDIQLDFIVEESIRSGELAGSYRIQEAIRQGQTLTKPQSQMFGVASTVFACSRKSFQARCRGDNQCLVSRVNIDEQGSHTIKISRVEPHSPEREYGEQISPSHRPDQLQSSVNNSQPHASWSILAVVNPCRPEIKGLKKSSEDEFKISKFSMLPLKSEAVNQSIANSFPRLYAEFARMAHPARDLLLDYTDDCAICIIEGVVKSHIHLRYLTHARLKYLELRGITGTLFWREIGGSQASEKKKTEFELDWSKDNWVKRLKTNILSVKS
ncbi:MAG: hypothetical protein M1816_004569 [Peltula sp. TS41687]|nr:MAG: hypothetical protein M1816_004569 [Peltula sp. TS41687]